jgi:hypothetical protein
MGFPAAALTGGLDAWREEVGETAAAAAPVLAAPPSAAGP